MTSDKTCHAGRAPLERRVGRDTSFRAMAVAELRAHRYCGDCYPDNGWPSVNAALAQYAKEKRMAPNE